MQGGVNFHYSALIEAAFSKKDASIRAAFCSFFGPKIGEKSASFSSWSLSESFSALVWEGRELRKWHLKGLYWLWVHKALVYVVSSNQPPYPPFSKERSPILLSSERKAPKTPTEREAPPTPTPTPQPPHTPTTPTQQEREGKTDLPQIDQNYNTRENHKRTPQNHKRPLRREGRLWLSINAVYDFGTKTINNVYGFGGV